MEQIAEKQVKELESTPATGLRVVFREFKKDKLALGSLIILILIIGGAIVGLH